jgi:hypothetical protein
MKVEIEEGVFDLETDTKIAITLTNPMLTDQGSFSLPFTIPAKSKKNMLLCKMPGNLNRAYYKTFAKDARVKCQGYEVAGTLKISSADSTSIELNLEANEGAFWNKVKKLKLTELNWGGKRGTPDYKLATAGAWLTYLNAHIRADKRYPDSDFAIFPILTKIEEDGDDVNYHIMNPIAHDNLSDQDGYRLSGIYGCANVAPFLWVNTTIDYIASHFNFRIVRNDLIADSLAKICVVLHNNMGSIGNGLLNYADIVPDCTVEEYITALEVRFGCTFYFDYSKKELSIVQHKHALTGEPVADLTEYLTSELTLSLEEGKPIKLTAGTSFERASTATEFEADFDYTIVATLPSKDNLPSIGGAYAKRAWFINREGCYYAETAGETEADYNKVTGYKIVSSKLFAYASRKADEYDTLESKEEQMVTVQIPNLDDAMSYQRWPFYQTGLVQRSGTSFYLKNTADSTPVSFCPYMGIVTTLSGTNKVDYPCGETNAAGYEFDLKSMYNRYYKEYEEFKLNSCKTVKATFRFPASVLSSLRMWHIYTIKNQPFIFKSIPVTLSEKGLEFSEVELVTVKKYLF